MVNMSFYVTCPQLNSCSSWQTLYPQMPWDQTVIWTLEPHSPPSPELVSCCFFFTLVCQPRAERLMVLLFLIYLRGEFPQWDCPQCWRNTDVIHLIQLKSRLGAAHHEKQDSEIFFFFYSIKRKSWKLVTSIQDHLPTLPRLVPGNQICLWWIRIGTPHEWFDNKQYYGIPKLAQCHLLPQIRVKRDHRDDPEIVYENG